MSSKGNLGPVAFYKGLSESEKVWVADWPEGKIVSRPKFSGSRWPDYLRTEYLGGIRLYACAVPREPRKLPEILESRIQRALSDHFCIDYYSKVGGRNTWLGQQEITDLEQLRAHEFRFDELPDIDDESAEVLRTLPIDSGCAP